MELHITCEIAGKPQTLIKDNATDHDLTVARNMMELPPAKVVTIKARVAGATERDYTIRAGAIQAVDTGPRQA